ncbi:alpha/beta fold hydrolase [Paenibacillus sp. HJGM_3]|uniref:alpha/beta fold hydrolase n=1 Tax=Paenibacillus sp. HJGM_3 TaxID=3379816 RepID=UPI00385DDE90
MKKSLITLNGKWAVTTLLAAALTVPTVAHGAGAAPTPAPVSAPLAELKGLSEAAVQAEQLVPARLVAESLGAQVTWMDETRSVDLKRGKTAVRVRIGDTQATVNGESVQLSSAVQLIDESTYVPLEVIHRAFGSGIGWDAQLHQIVVSEKDYGSQATLFLHQLENGQYSEAWSRLSATLQAVLPEPLLKAIWEGNKPLFGRYLQMNVVDIQTNAVHNSVTLECVTEKMPIQLTLRFAPSGLVDDWSLTPAAGQAEPYQRPAYDKQDAYKEREVVVGEGALALPGTLTQPLGEGPFPAVVLVQGSGPHDRDSTIGGAKPFRDIAAGLASQGIAVLRYEKVTKEHPFKVQAIPKFTIDQESVDDVNRAIDVLAGTKEIDPKRIYVAGHSQGGFVLPKIVAKDSSHRIAGVIGLSAPSGTFVDVLQEQQQVLIERMKQAGLPVEGVVQSAAMWNEIAKLVKNPEYSKDNLPQQFPIGGAYWWYEQRDYAAAAAAKGQSTPMLLLQGENDWQVPMTQLEGWKQALAGRTDVTYKSYSKLNHLLTEYDGISTGMEYNRSANVPEVLIRDMADWIRGLEK